MQKQKLQRLLTLGGCLLMVWLVAASPSQAALRVELEIVPTSKASYSAGQSWARALAELKDVRVRIRTTGRAMPDITRTQKSVRITAVIDAGDQLVTTERRFHLRQQKEIQAWIDRQRSNDPRTEVVLDRFGLTSDQLRAVHEKLKSRVNFDTKGISVGTSARQIGRRLGYVMRLSANTRRTLDGVAFQQELRGLTSGTALAALLRAAGHGFVPRPGSSGSMELAIVPEGSVKEAWPVGWESKLKRQELVPRIFDRLEIEITKTPIPVVLTAVGGRLEVPILLDEGYFQAAKIDPQTVKVSLPPGRKMSYSNLLRHVTFQARMKSTLLVDERGKAFFWVTGQVRPSSAKPKS